MALVLLPCDLPTWPAVQRQFSQISGVQTSGQLIEGMQKLHSMCCISLDPDENDRCDADTFSGLQSFIDSTLTEDERRRFFEVTLPAIVSYALRLKLHKPANGLHYSLQQQADFLEFDRRFLASLVANAFFSTFPRRTMKTHPTLQDCNFARFFAHLQSTLQQRKFKNFLAYFELIANEEPRGKVIFMRQVMSKKAELDMDDWLQCDSPLCPVQIRHDSKMGQVEHGALKVCCSSNRIGGLVLDGSDKQEDSFFCAFPELFGALLSTESLEYNETFTVHGLLPIAELQSHKESVQFQQILQSGNNWLFNTHICFLDATDFRLEPSKQFLESSILRELNKTYTGFRQHPLPSMRLPPIGKSCSSTPPEEHCSLHDVMESKTCSVPGQKTTMTTTTTSSDSLSLDVMKSLMVKKGGLCGLVNQMLLAHEGDVPHSDGATSALPDHGKGQEWDQIRQRPVLGGGGSGGVECQRPLQSDSSVQPNKISEVTSARSKTSAAFPLPKARRRAYNNLRLLDRGESDDSVYRDCLDILEGEHDDDDDEEGTMSSGGGGLAFQRPLRLSQPPRLPTVPVTPRPSSNASSSCPAAKQVSFEDVNIMEASFISCCSHVSSSGSEEEPESDRLVDDEVDENGFQSCSEEVSDNGGTEGRADSRCTTVAEQELIGTQQELFESGVARRNPVASLGRRMLPYLSDSQTEDGSCAMDIPIPGADVGDREDFVLRRTASTGFILDEDDDIFVGDDMEHEREWLVHFRHRSTNPSRSMSRRNSSRYSFSSDFSSDLEDIYEHFEERMTEGPLRDDPAFSCRLGDRMKRTLSDSLTALPRAAAIDGFPRSLSLTDRMKEERTNLDYARQCVGDSHVVGAPLVHPCSSDLMGMSPDKMIRGDATAVASDVDQTNCDVAVAAPPSSSSSSSQAFGKLVGTSYSTVAIEQNLSEVEESVTLPLPHSHRLMSIARLPSQLSVWWNYNSMYDFCVPLNQCSKRHRSSATVEGDSCLLTLSQKRSSQLDTIDEGDIGNIRTELLPECVPDITFAQKAVSVGTRSSEARPSVVSPFGGRAAGAPIGAASTAGALQLPARRDGGILLGIYRSKSSSNAEDLARNTKMAALSPSSFDALLSSGIAKSRSLKDVKDFVRRDAETSGPDFVRRGRSNVHLASGHSGEHAEQPRLRKWQAAVNLNDLAESGASADLCGRMSASGTSEGAVEEGRFLLDGTGSGNSTKCTRTAGRGAESSKTVHEGLGRNDRKSSKAVNGRVGMSSPLDVDARVKNGRKVVDAGPRCSHSTHDSAISRPHRSVTGMSEKFQSLPYGLHASEQLVQPMEDINGVRSVVTGNWGCTDGKCGDPQLKALIQWMAASRANVPCLVYYTGGDHRIVKFSVVSRLLLDRHWSVSHIAHAILAHYNKPVRWKTPDSESPVDLLESLLPKETDL